ncbi:hypothetical protein [Anaeromyxobacter oryzae]|uniref:ResB-like domain-containing protein n=1 Tax=Anaeromyxobacter oryzae TaxID=2918170 RepID=A0ABM7X2Y0_9BACT|nr:hypothetical protein [Anaeromyxobacter oryzae]BDG06139.1 hypothetical protein AMOR_51350 [Anaeromyxobacter oryzae]
MPSDSRLDRPDRLAWLRSQGLGLACGFATVVLLAVGSFVLAGTRDGASAGIGMDDLRGFFAPPSWVHLWFYLLLPVAALYALNTVLATWDTVSRRWRAGVRAPSSYAPSVVHVGFLLALAAHAVGGFRGAERGEVILTEGWQPVPGFGEVRLASLDVETLPGGMPRDARAEVLVRGADGREREDAIGYNDPLSSGAGARLALLSELGQVRVAELGSGGDGCVLAEGQGCLVAGERIEALRVATIAGGGGAALVRARGPSGAVEARWLRDDGELALAGNRPLQLRAVREVPAVLVRVREAPGNPWALAASLVLAAGLALMWRRFVPRRAAARDTVDPGERVGAVEPAGPAVP